MRRELKINKHRVDGDVIWIELSLGKEACVDLADWPSVSQHRWSAIKSRNTFYAATNVPLYPGAHYTVPGVRYQKQLSLHRFLTGAKLCDHKDLNGLNNRRDNLRPCTQWQNQVNQPVRRNNVSGFKGVYRQGKYNRWAARITMHGKRIFLGDFGSPQEAGRAYRAASIKHHGEFACIC